MIPSSDPSRNRNWFGSGERWPAFENSSRGGALNDTTASVAVTGIDLPARTNQGTPAHRHDSISNRHATKVSVSEPGCTPGSSVYPRYWPRATLGGSNESIWRRSFTFSSCNALADDD